MEAGFSNAAAVAEQFQPKGITLATTEVKTKIPFLLKHSLREYQHIGLDWLVAMHEKRLNGILADEMGLGEFNLHVHVYSVHVHVHFKMLLYFRKNHTNDCTVGPSCLWRRQLGPSFNCCSYISDAQLGVWTQKMVSCLQTPHIFWPFQRKEAEENCMLTIICCELLIICHFVFRVGQSVMLFTCASPPIILLLQTIELSNRWSGSI